MDLDTFVQQCHEALKVDDPSNKLALNYLLAGRGLTERTLADHSIGYCSSAQPTPGESERKNAVLKGRIIVPIYEEFGKIVGLAARSPNPSESGWWNTSFEKNNHIFLFNRSRKAIFDADKIYIFEGYMDGLVLFQEGLPNVGALMGTSLGYRRIGLLKRYCNRVCLVFDADVNNAGQRAHDRSVFELTRFLFSEISHIALPLKVDPDEFVLKHGLKEFLALEQLMTKDDKDAAVDRHLHWGDK